MFKTNSNKVVIIVLIITITLSFIAYYFISKKISIDTVKAPVTYSAIEVFGKKEENSIGFVKIKNKKIVTNINDIKIRQFIDANVSKWETSTLSYPTGGYMRDGTLWDGSDITNIDSVDHIISIYTILDDKFNNEYSIRLIKDN